MITVSRRKRGTDEPRTIHSPDCWHATNDTEPPEADWDAVVRQPSDSDAEVFEIPPDVWQQHEEHRDWESTGRLRRRTVTRAELQPGPHSTIIFEGNSYKRCERCTPDIW